jgi:hypothetical protein
VNSAGELQKREIEQAQLEELAAAKASHERNLAKLKKQHKRQLARENEAFAQQQQLAQTRFETEKLRRDLEASRTKSHKDDENRPQSCTTAARRHSSPIADCTHCEGQCWTELDDRTVVRFRKLGLKIDKMRNDFDAASGWIPGTIRDTVSELTIVCQGYRNLVTEQNRVIVQMSADFQHQITQLSRGFQLRLTDLEQSYRNAYGLPPTQALSVPTGVIDRPTVHRENPVEWSSNDSYDESEGKSDTEQNVQPWRLDNNRN